MSSKRQWIYRFVVFSLLFLSSGWAMAKPAMAQLPSCEDVITGLATAIEQCSELNHNWACYGQSNAAAIPDDVRFYQPRDRQPIEILQAINVVRAGTVLMHLYLDGEQDPLEVVVFGSAVVTSDGETSNSFILTNDPTSVCPATPAGMVVRTEAGKRSRFTINEVDIELHSVAFITMLSPDVMAIVNVEGAVTVTIAGAPITLAAGQQVRVAGISSGQPVLLAGPELSPFAGLAVLQFLAANLDLNDNKVDINPAVTACGGAISYGSSVVAANVLPGQECLYTFQGQAGDVVSVNIDAIDSTLNPSADLRAPDLRLVRTNNDADIGDFNSLICNEGLAVSGEYTIVARPHRNASTGGFQLTLNRHTDCAPPPPLCQVIVPRGQNRRAGPGLEFPINGVLPAGAQITALRASADRAWVEVTDVQSGESGWMNTNHQLLLCDVPPGEVENYPPVVDPCTLENPPPDANCKAKAASTTDPTPPPPPKESPFGEP